MKNFHSILVGSLFLIVIGCGYSSSATKDLLSDNIENAILQYSSLIKQMDGSSEILTPRTMNEKGEVESVPYTDWASRFFPGSMWHMYSLTADSKWKSLAMKYTEVLAPLKYFAWHQDVGGMIGCSYLNGVRQGNEKYGSVVVSAAKSLATRFRPNVGAIQSWDTDKGWQAKRNWSCPVIIESLMNLEILFEATRLSGDSTYYYMAVAHADKMLQNHFRADYSSYHVVDYDINTGEVRSKQTVQGYADESSWARGQASALYGYTMCYRYTQKKEYLTQAYHIYDYIFMNEKLPADLIPYWDYNALNIPNEPRDVSAAAITASALYELSSYRQEKKYKETADAIIATLTTPEYRAEVGTNGHFMLKHSAESIPHDAEIDVPLHYADYYFLEALVRKRDLEKY